MDQFQGGEIITLDGVEIGEIERNDDGEWFANLYVPADRCGPEGEVILQEGDFADQWGYLHGWNEFGDEICWPFETEAEAVGALIRAYERGNSWEYIEADLDTDLD